MIEYEIFIFGLLIASAMTSLITEAVKVLLDELGKNYKPNLLAGIVAVIVSVAMAAGYIILTDMVFTAKIAVVVAALVILSWLCAMLGYDKIIQTISQFRKGG